MKLLLLAASVSLMALPVLGADALAARNPLAVTGLNTNKAAMTALQAELDALNERQYNPLAGMVPAAALSTNALRVTCPICQRVAVVPAKKLMTTEASVAPGGTIQTRSTLVRCKCGEIISARLKVFMPEPRIVLVPANGKAPVVTFTSPKLRAPSDTNSIR